MCREFVYQDPLGQYLYFLQVVNGGLAKATTYNGKTCTLSTAGYMVRVLLDHKCASQSPQQAGQLQLVGGTTCYALSALPATSYVLDTNQSPQVLSVSFAGGINNKYIH